MLIVAIIIRSYRRPLLRQLSISGGGSCYRKSLLQRSELQSHRQGETKAAHYAIHHVDELISKSDTSVEKKRKWRCQVIKKIYISRLLFLLSTR